MPPTLRHRLEYAVMRVVTGALAPLGTRRAARVGDWVGSLGYAPLGIRRAVAERQIAAAFPALDRAGVSRLARDAYRNVGRVAVEAALVSRGSAADVLEMFGASPTWSVVERALAQGRGVILVAGHLGNWELSGAYVAARGVTVHAVARGMANPLSDAWFRRTRERLGMRIVHDQEAVRRVPRALRDGQAVGILFDQATVGLASTYVPFFGRPAKTPRGAAVFAIRCNAPVVLIQAVRQGDGRYEFVAEDIAVSSTGDLERDTDDIILRLSQALERLVRRHPGQYFWQHRRWKHQPPDTPPELGEP